MPEDDSKEKVKGLEVFKTASMFISSVIIAATGIFATCQYNSGQLEISRNKEMTGLIPKLGESDANVRKFSAISLALYGKDAVPSLMATLSDENPDVRLAGAKALSIIGDAAIDELTNAYKNQRNDINLRALALYTLGLMRASNAYELAASALENPSENPIVRKDAATVLGLLREKRAAEKLLSALKVSKATDVALTTNILFSLGEIQNVTVTDDFTSLLDHPNEEVRYQTVWALAKIGGEKALNILSQVESNDKSERVRQAAKDAYAWIKPKQ